MNRDSFFDNYKGFLIVLVVVGHFINPLTDESSLMNFITVAIYSFHMPAFVFISAYFGKRNSLLKLMKNLFVPYVIFQILYSVLINTIWGLDEDFHFFDPAFTLWFLISLFCWRALIDRLVLIKWLLPISFALGILVAFDRSIGEFMSLGRTIAFFPYFVLGYKFDKDKFMKFADKTAVKVISAILLLVVLLFIKYMDDKIPFHLLTLKFNYKKIHLPQWGFIYRAGLYAVSTLIIYLLAVIMPRGRHWYSYLGQRTFGIYILQGIVFKSIYNMTDLYKRMNTNLEFILITLFAVVLAFILSLKPFDYLIKKICLIPIEKLLIHQPEKDKNNS